MVVLLFGLILQGIWFAQHASYYLLPAHEQADHAEHSALRSSGALGLGLGVTAIALFLTNLSYLVRRRFLSWRVGSLRTWLAFHVTTGLLGAGFVLLHSAAGVRSASGTMAAIALGIVVLSGMIGRYFYSLVPRTIEGRELELSEGQERLQDLTADLRQAGITLELPEMMTRRRPSLMRLLRALWVGDPQWNRTITSARRSLLEAPDLPGRDSHLEALGDLRRKGRFLASLREMQALMTTWRFLHRWLALVMLGTVFFHILLAVRWGELTWFGIRP